MVARIRRRGELASSASFALLACACGHEVVLGDRMSQAALEAGSSDVAEPVFDAGGDDAPSALDAADGAIPAPIWFADHETADLSQWQAGGNTSGGDYELDATLEISTWHAHRGKYSLRCLIETADHNDHIARAYRHTVDGGAFYSSWFFWEAAHRPAEWWSIFLFRAQVNPSDPGVDANVWDLYVVPGTAGQMTLALFDHLTNQMTMASPETPLPIGEWVHIEAYFEYAPPKSTHLAFWLNGVSVLDAPDLGAAPSPDLVWAIGNGSNGLTPTASDLYIDDAAISRARIGPR